MNQNQNLRYDVTVMDDRIYFEHLDYGEDSACCVYLDDSGNIHDYDMCYTIPLSVGWWLKDHGYNVELVIDEHGEWWNWTDEEATA